MRIFVEFSHSYSFNILLKTHKHISMIEIIKGSHQNSVPNVKLYFNWIGRKKNWNRKTLEFPTSEVFH